MSAFLDNIKTYLEGRLQIFDPTIDLSPGSPAEVEVIDPLISRLGTDPFEINVKEFITQRLTEQYPDLATDIGELEDLVVNPLVALLEPYKYELNKMALNQSLSNVDLMNDEEVDSLGANWFETRNEGGFASGTARLFYSTPRNSTISTSKKLTSKSGLAFLPVVDTTISSSQMLFNRQGDLYYVDINVVAEQPGDSYNIDKQELISIDNVDGVIKVTNILPFTGGVPRESNTEFVARISQSLTERSLVTKRGVVARINNLFDSVRAIQVIGAGEEGMNRDILEGTGEGFLHHTASVVTFGNWVLFKQTFYKDTGPLRNITITPGDIIRFHKIISLDPNRVVSQHLIKRVLWTSGDTYLLEIDKDLGSGISGFVAVFKPGFITISKVPEGMLSTTVPSNKVHLGGHSDIYIRPSDDRTDTATVNNITGSDTIVALLKGKLAIGTNDFATDPPDPINLGTLGIEIGDTVVIETGTQAGTYRVLEIGTTLKLDHIFTATETNLRAKIYRNLRTNLNEPKTIKLPFNTPVNDLRTIVGSKLFRLNTTNIQSYGAVVGDVIEILDGPDAGKYIITSFDTVLGGQGPIVDRAAGATGTNLRYRVYSTQPGLEFPFVRIKSIEQLDSSNQTTGVTVPYGDAVDIRNDCDFETLIPSSRVLDMKLFQFPDLLGYWNSLTSDPATPGVGVDARYTQLLQPADGVIRKFPADGVNPITTIEVNIPPFTYDGRKNTLLGFVTEKDLDFSADPSGNPQTSPLAKSRRGDIINIFSGPNSGTYLIEDVRVLDLWKRVGAGHAKIALIQVDRELQTDPIRNCIDIIAYGALNGSGVTPITSLELLKMIEFSTDWSNPLGFYENILIPRLRDTFIFFGFAATSLNTRDILNSISLSGYETGTPAKGELRMFFIDPVSVDMFTDSSNPTLFQKISSDAVPKFARISTDIKSGQVLPQSFEDSLLKDWLRIGTMKTPTDASFALTSGPTFAKRGVQTGDKLEFYPAINDYTARGVMNSSYMCCTQAGSNIVTLILPSIINNPKVLAPGQLLFIDSGPDAGQYTIVETMASTYPDFRVKVDRTMTHTTLPYPSGVVFAGTTVSGLNQINDVALPGSLNVGDYITIYGATNSTILVAGNDTAYLGSFKIMGLGAGFAVLDRTSPFPAVANISWIGHPAPTTLPNQTSGGGAEISNQYVRVRVYDSVLQTREITINWAAVPNPLDPTSVDQIILDQPLTSMASTTLFSHKSPFRIIRDWIKRISSTTMAKNRINGLYYLDVQVIALGLGEEFNFAKNTPFKLAGKYNVHGYRYAPEDENFTFSTKEIVDLILPVSILPVGSTPSQENEIKLAGQSLQFIYDNAPIIDEIQRFFDSPLDRVVNSNPLVRHFLPAYVILNAKYLGGSLPDIISKDLINYINTISPDDNQVRVDAITRILQKRGARQITLPIELIALVHGLDRTIRAIRSENSIGGDFPTFKGVNKMIYFIPGPDTSNEDPQPDGEQVYLVRS